jgi:pimeloyl-ACP methyl ester carboxylesterase
MNHRFLQCVSLALVLALPMATLVGVQDAAVAQSTAGATATAGPPVVYYRSKQIEGLNIFYREAGPADAPVLLLLHGFPASSHMFRNLIPLLADRYHVIAPDYPGYGESSAPDHTAFKYTFGHIVDIVDTLMGQLGANRYALYLMDYGAPIGYRLALKHPDRVSAMIVQNGNAYNEGLQAFWDPFKAYWADGSAAHRAALAPLLTLPTTKFQYTDGMSDIARIDPDNWLHDQTLMDRPGNKEIQLDLFYDYRTNVAMYPQFQAFFHKYQPPMIIVWGKNDKIFPTTGATPYLRDLPKAELHMIDSGHFALEDQLDQMEPLIHAFLDRTFPTSK